MAKNSKWQDEYWLLLMQIYLQKPVGMKPMYCRAMVDLSIELHIAPNLLFNKMCQIANLETPRIEHIWETYGNNPRKLTTADMEVSVKVNRRAEVAMVLLVILCLILVS